jgi:hypothetical protein
VADQGAVRSLLIIAVLCTAPWDARAAGGNSNARGAEYAPPADLHCPEGSMVWAHDTTKRYRLPMDRGYGRDDPKNSHYMCRADADKAGYRALNK